MQWFVYSALLVADRLKSNIGEVSEWLKEHAWKVCIRQRIEGSNPSLSAKLPKLGVAPSTGMSAEDFRDPIEGQIPIGRMLQPEEVANISIYLASDESNGMTGQTITLSGGMRMG
jgi:hypothetical protein